MAYVFTHATVLDGTADMEPRPNTTVVVDDEGRIAAIGAAEEIVPPASAQEIDIKGAYLAPGLVNLHVHLCGSGKPTSAGAAGDLIDKVVGNPIGMWYLRRIIKQHAQQQLASGVTTVRSVGDPGFADVDVRDAINAGSTPGRACSLRASASPCRTATARGCSPTSLRPPSRRARSSATASRANATS